MVNYTRNYSDRPCIKCDAVIVKARGPQRYCVACKTKCGVDGCTNKVWKAGKCESHGRPKFAVPQMEPIAGRCGIEGCGRKVQQKGVCALHYDRAYRYGDFGAAKPRARQPIGVPCLVEGCEKPAVGRGYCQMHYARLRTKGDAGPAELLRKAQGEGSVTDTGYLLVAVDGVSEYEHRRVMEKKLGRGLRPSESVHHIDGDKLNNDPSNLELWSRYQPSGQRVSDKVRAAIALIREHTEIAALEGVRLVNLESQEATNLLLREQERFTDVSSGLLGFGS